MRGLFLKTPAGLALALAALCSGAWAQPAQQLAQPPAQQPVQDWQIGRAKAQACSVCHGPAGIAVQPDAANLAGQPAPYLVAQLRAYRSGARRHEVMNVMAKPLTNEDIDHLAAWFSSIVIEVKPPQ